MTTEPNLPSAVALVPAGFWRRFWAHLIDSFVLAVLIPGGVGVCLGAAGPGVLESWMPYVGLVILALQVAYTVAMEYMLGATLGKLLLNIAVVGVHGERLPPGPLIGRWVTKCILWILTLGTESLLAGRKSGLTLHDTLSGTRVVRTCRVYT